MSLPFYDGRLERAVRVGPCIPTVDPVTYAHLYTYTYQQLEPNYLADLAKPGRVSGDAALSQRDPTTSAFLVKWGEPKAIGCGVLEFTRTYAHVPPTRQEFELFNHNYQYYISGGLVEVPVLVKSRIVYSYIHTTKPESITLLTAPRYYMVGSSLNVFGNERDLDKPEYLGEDETIFRWENSNIWGKKSRYVEKRNNLVAV